MSDPNGERVPDYLVAAVLTTFLACTPFGMISWYYSVRVQQYLHEGNRQGAIEASKKARGWAWIAFYLGILSYVAFGLFVHRFLTVWWPYNVMRGEFRL